MRIYIFIFAINVFLLISCSSNKIRKNGIKTKDKCITIDISKYTDNIISTKDTIKSTDESHYKLNHKYPNPFSPITKLRFELINDSDVCIELYNTIGELIITGYNAKLSKGKYIAEFKNVGLKAGVYFVKLSVNKQKVEVRKLLFTN